MIWQSYNSDVPPLSMLCALQATFKQCEATAGGATFFVDSSTLIEGPVTMTGCNATIDGGALAVIAGTLRITGLLCASNNTAASNGAFAAIVGGLLEVTSGANVSVGDNTPANSTLFLKGELKCGADSSPWASPQFYSVQGPLCACSAAFEANTSTTCDSCGNKG